MLRCGLKWLGGGKLLIFRGVAGHGRRPINKVIHTHARCGAIL